MALSTLPTLTPSGYSQFAAQSFASAIALPTGSTPDKVLLTCLGPDPAIVLIATAAATTTGTAASGSVTMTVASPTSIVAGQGVVGSGIAPGTYVQSITGSTITLSQATTAALSTTAVNFVNPVTKSTGIAVTAQMPISLAYVSSGFISAIAFGQVSVLNVAVGV